MDYACGFFGDKNLWYYNSVLLIIFSWVGPLYIGY